MKALILCSGRGTRMGDATRAQPKCLLPLTTRETILSRQLRLLREAGVSEAIITTGAFAAQVLEAARMDGLPVSFVHNPCYLNTNYIYSMYLASMQVAGEFLLLHGDLVFDPAALQTVMQTPHSCMAVDSTSPLPQKDFKAVLDAGRIRQIGISCFDSAVAAQPLYHLTASDWQQWAEAVRRTCQAGYTNRYAEDALNPLLQDAISLHPTDVQGHLCMEVDTPADWAMVNTRLKSESE